MKIIEGTPEEIDEYLKKESEKSSFAQKAKEQSNSKTENYLDGFLKYRLKNEYHWSGSKQEWIPIKDMNSVYITNVLRKKLNADRGVDLLEDKEFKSLIINLYDRILEK